MTIILIIFCIFLALFAIGELMAYISVENNDSDEWGDDDF